LTGYRNESALRSTILQNIQVAFSAGVDWIQVREKDLQGGQLLEVGRVAVDLAATHGKKTESAPRIIINDRLDVALTSGAHGVHLGRESAPAHDVVRWCRAGNAPNGFVIGVSCHSIEEAREAENAKADYIFFGPVFETPSKLPFGAPQGIQTLSEVCRTVAIPVVAIGGVSQENAAACIRAGASGIAAIRMFQESPDSKAVAESVASIHDLRRDKV
jgi:thiamine-phosphate pyrophosphorylase